MAGLQEFIHKIELGEGAKVIKWITVILGFVGLAVAYDIQEQQCFVNPEAMEAGQLARNLAEGRGYSTHFIRPLSMQLIQQRRGDNDALIKTAHPDLATPPLYPVLLAGLMKVAPFQWDIPRETTFFHYQPEIVIAVANQVLFMLAIWLVYCLGKRMFDAFVGGLSALIMAGSLLFWRFSVSGLSTMLLVVIFLGLVWGLARLEQGTREPQHGGFWFLFWSAVVGGLTALGGLTRYAFAWMIIPVVAFLVLFFPQRRFFMTLAALTVFIGLMAPWITRNYQVSGTFFGTAGYAAAQDTTLALQSTRLERSLGEELDKVSQLELQDYSKKLLINASQIVQNDLPRLGGNWISGLFLVGLLVAFNSPTVARVRYFLLMSLLLMVVVQAIGRTHLSTLVPDVNSENLLVVLAPLVFLYGVSLYSVLVDQIEVAFPRATAAISTFVLAVASLPLILVFLPPKSFPVVYPPYFPPLIQQIGGWYNEDELTMSDMPWAVAWYGGRDCLWYTQNPQEAFFKINDFQKPVKALYLTQLSLDGKFQSQLVKGDDRPWGRFALEVLLTSKVPSGFPLRTALSVILPEQILLADRERWNVPEK
ncbi:MAG TPA: hypothetical protein P5186_03430 [Candidatus Paceibacterota bacterium]|nr:hypothetical protein [Verrucomicrobiota bacterium]HRY47077.1 hypothetical protein [Candidatus Paceibacterota bacterium]HSA00353.1 hypothetical protein [Candidatus Paceibacterota bacterium]